MQRIITVALGVVIALTALAATSAQNAPDHTFYGNDATAGDTIGIVGADGSDLGSTTVAADGSWFKEVPRAAAEGVSFTVNGEAATADTEAIGENLTQVSNLTVPEPPAADCPDDSMSEGDEDSMMEDDSMSEDGDAMSADCPDDSMMDEGDSDDSMMGDEDEGMLDEDTANGYPETGTGGLADTSGGISAGLIGLLIAIAAVALTGLSLRRLRNRA